MDEGYAKIAQLMHHNPDYCILRKFEQLQLEDLLLQQAQLTELEIELRDIVAEDSVAQTAEQRQYHVDWWYLKRSSDFGSCEQLEKRLEIRKKLKEYNEHASGLAFLQALPRPKRYSLRFFHDWFKDVEMGNNPLSGNDRDSWTADHETDLMLLRNQSTPDALFSTLARWILPKYHLWLGKRLHKPSAIYGVATYDDASIQRVFDIVVTVISSLFPVASIVVLFFISDMAVRLGVVAGSTALFSFCLAFVTSAKRVEIFAATTAYVYGAILTR